MATAVAHGATLSIMFIARSLEVGGAERQLVTLARELTKRGNRVSIALFYCRGSLVDEAKEAGIELIDLDKKGRLESAGFLGRTIAAVRRSRPDIVYSMLGGPNVVAALAKPFIGRTKLVWSILNTGYDSSVDDWLARLAHGLETALSNFPDIIISNSVAGRDFAIGRNFPPGRTLVVPNGIDTKRFQLDARLRVQQRRVFGLDDGDVAIGTLGRLNATKDYPTFLRAAEQVSRSRLHARFLCVGEGPDRPQLEQLARDLGIDDRVTFTGEMDPVAALNTFDIACSASVTEGFSNSIAEAMSCGLPCVVTDVGDSAAIVGETGIVVPPSSPTALAGAIERQIASLHEHRPEPARDRIVENFSIEAVTDRTLDIFRSLVSRSL